MIDRIFAVASVAMTVFASSLLADDSNTTDNEKVLDNNSTTLPSFRSSSTNRLSALNWFSSTQDSSFLDSLAAQPRIPLLALDPPTGLNAEVYSSSALELFWDRVTDTVLSYEVRQDTRSIGFTDGTSFFISSGVEPGVEYNFEVIARFDNNPGVQISESAKITVSLGDGDTIPAMPGPVAPENVSIARYSSSTAELFWDRAPASERVVSTEVFRDGVLLGSTNGTSFMDWSRTEGQVYEYTLVAIDADGARSSESILVDGDQTPDNPETGIFVDESNLDEILEVIAFITRGEPVNDIMDIAQGLGFGDFDELLQSQPSEPQESFRVTVENFSCEETGLDDVGSLVRTTIDRGNSSSIDVEVDNCSILGSSVNGNVLAEFGVVSVTTVNELVVTTSDKTSKVSGSYTDTLNADTGIRVLDFSYEEDDVEGSVELAYYGVESTVGLDVMWSVGSSEPDSIVYSASSDISFEREATDTEFTVGTLNVVFESGPSVMIDADNGDAASFTVTVEDGDVSSSYTVDWNEANRYFLSFDAD